MSIQTTTIDPSAISLEALEGLAASILTEAAGQRAKLHRLITVFAKILSVREPGKFEARATECADEDGHYDNSFPPDQEYKEFTGPRLYAVVDFSENSKATSSGFYHDIAYFTEDCGLYIGRDGSLWGGEMSGTGRLGQFAAHPGECNVECEISWDTIDLDDVPMNRLVKAERELRALAFPASTKA